MSAGALETSPVELVRIQAKVRRYSSLLMQHPDQRDLIERTNRAGVDFLFTDIEMAFTFLHVGETSTSPETRDRNFGKSLQGYRTVLHFLSRVVLSPVQRTDLEEKLRNLKTRLEKAGVSCDT